MLKLIVTSNRPEVHTEGDCVVNALSIAYNKPYEEVLKDFDRYNDQNEENQFQLRYNYVGLIEEYGYIDYLEDYLMDYPTLKKFAMEHPKGTYLVNLKYPLTTEGHMTVIKDGDLYDVKGAAEDCWPAKVEEAWRVK